jgi:hypothetical protein
VIKPESKAASYAADRSRPLYLSSLDLDTALGSLAALSRVSDNDVRVSLLRDIVVTYARPFSGNRGPSNRSHRLSDLLPAVVPKQNQALHAKLIRFRDQLFAHTDLEAYKPVPVKWEQHGQATFPMTFWALDYETLNGYVAELTELVESVESAVHDEITRIESTL